MKLKNINNLIGSRTSNSNKCHCFYRNCNASLDRGEGHPIVTRYGLHYVCDNHYCTDNMLSYHGNRRTPIRFLGTDKIGAIEQNTVAVEFELYRPYNSVVTDNEMSTVRWLLADTVEGEFEHDGTVEAENPSQPMNGINRLSKVLQGLEHYTCNDGKTLLENLTNHQDCGGHIHIYCNDIQYIRRYYHSIFLPLHNYINAMDTEKRVEIFGSDFRYYAQHIDAHTEPTNHGNFVNTQHNETLEFRLARIVNHKQYIKVVKFWRECVAYINNFDLCKTADAGSRKRRAVQCGLDLVKIAKKYFD